MSKTPTNFRLDDKLIANLKRIAAFENRSLTNLIETELIRFSKIFTPAHNSVRAIKKEAKHKTKKP